MTVRKLLKALFDDGWYLDKHRGTSHRQLKHSSKKGKVTVAGNPGDEVPKGTLHRILKQAGLSSESILK